MRSRLLLAAAAALILVVLTAFGGTVGHGFSDVDDPKYVTDNTHVREGLSWESVKWAFTSMDAANWHPLTWLSHMADVTLFGLDPTGHHAINVVLHAVSTILLFFMLWRTTGLAGPSLIVAAVFAAHPLRVESVAWIAERKDVLSMVFAMGTLLAYDAYLRKPRPGRFGIVVVLFVCGLMAKPMLVTLPILLLLLDDWPYGRIGDAGELRGVIREKLPLFAASAASCVLTVLAQSGGRAVESLASLPPGTRIANALASIAIYVAQTFWPAKLAFFYPHPGYVAPGGNSLPLLAAALVLVIGVTGWAIARRAERPYVFVGWVWFLVSLVPVIGLVQVGEQAHADRYTYLPMIGLLIALVWGLLPWVERGGAVAARVTAAAVLVIVAVLVHRTRVQVAVWEDPRAIYRQALAHTARNYVAHNNLGVLLARDGLLDDARSHLEAAVAILPDYAQAEDNLGNLLVQQGRVTEAIPRFETALARSQDPEIRNNLGNALIAAGRVDEGIRRLEEAVAMRPDYALAHYNLAMALGRIRRSDEALGHFDLAIRYRPDRAASWANRGLLLATLGRRHEAASDFRRALELQPDWTDVRLALDRVNP